MGKAAKRAVRKIANVFSLLLCVALVFFSSVMGGEKAKLRSVKAEGDIAAAYEQTNVMDDLQGVEIAGKDFSISNYAFDAKKTTQVLSFVEFCYSFYPEKQGDYGLYFYLWNPKGLQFVEESPLNKIALTYGERTTYVKYPIEYLNKSEETNFEGLFYKFKVTLTETQKETILERLNSSERVYRVSGVELLQAGNTNATEFGVGTTYRYTGYASGYGANAGAESTLTTESEELETLSLEVNSTYYRPEGTNGKNEFTQDSLHSVYFAVPKSIEKKYGGMTAVHAEWLNAVLSPMLVTGNAEAYNAILPYLGQNIGEGIEDLYYAYVGAYADLSGLTSPQYACGYFYNYCVSPITVDLYGDQIETLTLMFSTNGVDAADYTVSSEEIQTQMEKMTSQIGGELVNGKYSKALFSHVDEQFTEVNLTSSDVMKPLTSETVGASWWDKLWGNTTTETFDGIKAIYPVTEEDMQGSTAEVSERLYISTADHADFLEFYNANKATSTVYLFRYQVSDYVAQTATRFDRRFGYMHTTGEEDAYFAEETVNLDFDVIDVTFSNGATETVMAVVSNPIDVIGDLTPPVSFDDESWPWWVWAIIVVGAIFVLYLVFKFIKVFWEVVKILFLIVTFPVWGPIKFIVWLIRKIGGDYD